MKRIAIILISTSLISGIGCRKEDIGYKAKSQFTVKMTDSPGDYKALDLTVLNVQVYSENSEWVTISNEVRTFNVLSLRNGTSIDLASETEVDVGSYSKLRLQFSEVVVLTLNAEADILGLDLESNNRVQLEWEGPSTVEVAINQHAKAGMNNEILLDFDVASSIIQRTKGLVIKPTIRMVTNTSTGIKGEVTGVAQAAVLVSDGTNSFSAYTGADGKFLVRGMGAGTYTVKVFPETKRQKNHEPIVMEQVVVTEGSVKHIGTCNF